MAQFTDLDTRAVEVIYQYVGNTHPAYIESVSRWEMVNRLFRNILNQISRIGEN